MGLPNIHGGDVSELVLGIFMTNKFEVYSTDDTSGSSFHNFAARVLIVLVWKVTIAIVARSLLQSSKTSRA